MKRNQRHMDGGGRESAISFIVRLYSAQAKTILCVIRRRNLSGKKAALT